MAINHINNFATNLTADQAGGVTTTALNSIPSISAPFYLALDATNINGNYEVVLVTSKTATNVNHVATGKAHTTAEEVRCVMPAEEMDAISQGKISLNAPQGFLLNGKIVPSVGSNNLTVSIKTLAGTDASTTDPIYVRIGDTVRSITTALSITKNAGTNWCNAGSAELATKEIDYFVYLGYNATDGVVIGFSRCPGCNQYSDFSVTTTNEKYCAISTITNASATDYYEVIGRFAATLSAGAGYTWSVPAFTAINLIQRPVYETRELSFSPQYTGFSANPAAVYIYKLSGNICLVECTSEANGTSSTNAFTITMPLSCKYSSNMFHICFVADNGVTVAQPGHLISTAGSATLNAYKSFFQGTWTGSNVKGLYFKEVRYLI